MSNTCEKCECLLSVKEMDMYHADGKRLCMQCRRELQLGGNNEDKGAG